MNEISFNLPGDRGKGSCMLEPLNTWENFFDKDGKTTPLIQVYDQLHNDYLKSSRKINNT
ncbi:MAG: hypothetical protein NVS9B7_18850 [Flavisolibacter sp.]